MSEHPGASEQGTTERDGKVEFYYEGSSFPWFMRIVWIAFLVFAVVYIIKWFVPDLMAYLKDPASLLQ
jgi:hypothetical protein